MFHELAETLNFEHLCLKRSRRHFWLHRRLRTSAGSPVFNETISKFSNSQTDATCPLCFAENEDLCHFLFHCSALSEHRKLLANFISQLRSAVLSTAFQETTADESKLAQIIIDPTQAADVHPDKLMQLETTSRRLCFNLHSKRIFLMKMLS